MTGDDTLERLQADALAILRVVPSLEAINIIEEDDGDMDAKVMRAIGAISGGSTGRPGCVAVVMLPEAVATDPNQPGPPMTYQLKVQVIEQPVINRSDAGTQIRSSVAALRILNALQLQGLGSALIYTDERPIVTVEVKTGFISHMVTMMVRMRGMPPATRPESPTVTLVDTDLELACATVDAAIYYTLNGRFPTPASGKLYEAAFPAIPGTTVRAVAYVTGQHPSDVLEFTVNE